MIIGVKNYIEKYKDDIEKGDFDTFYSHMAAKTMAAFLTETLLDAGIDPLDYLTKIPEYYGQYSTKFKILDIPSQIKTVGENAFSECMALKEVTLHEGVIAIRNAAFYSCHQLEKINIPESCLFLGSRALQYSAIKSIELPNISSIFQSTFNGCTDLTEVKFGDNISSIEQMAFRGCTSLTQIDLPKKLEILGSYAFTNCTNLQVVTIPQTLKYINMSVFDHCPSLKRVIYEGTVQQWKDLKPIIMFDEESSPMINCADGDLIYSFENKVWVKV